MTQRSDKIITSHVYPPIPIRSNDWCAYRENDVEDSSRYAWGHTEAEAIANLLADEEDRD